jgi:hypothetical protein
MRCYDDADDEVRAAVQSYLRVTATLSTEEHFVLTQYL